MRRSWDEPAGARKPDHAAEPLVPQLGACTAEAAAQSQPPDAVHGRHREVRGTQVVVGDARREMMDVVHWASWDTGFVAADAGVIVGFAAVEFEAWHRRLVLWHLYVQPSHRRRGVGRALLAHVEDFGRRRKAQRVWLETTSVNVPGILAYERLGYSLCGADVTMYDGLPYAREAALFLAKSLGG